jgi:hypothetical protein
MRGDASELAHALDRLVATLAHHPRAAAPGRRGQLQLQPDPRHR